MKPASTTSRALTAAPIACSATSRRKPLTKALVPVVVVLAGQVGMGVDEARAERRVAEVDDLAPSGIGDVRPGGDDLRALDHHHSGTRRARRTCRRRAGRP